MRILILFLTVISFNLSAADTVSYEKVIRNYNGDEMREESVFKVVNGIKTEIVAGKIFHNGTNELREYRFDSSAWNAKDASIKELVDSYFNMAENSNKFKDYLQKDCMKIDRKKHHDEFRLCFDIQRKAGCGGIYKGNFPQERAECDKLLTQAKSNCEEVTEQYTICNGVRYVRDLKNNDSLKRNIKEIEDFIGSEKPSTKASAVHK